MLSNFGGANLKFSSKELKTNRRAKVNYTTLIGYGCVVAVPFGSIIKVYKTV